MVEIDAPGIMKAVEEYDKKMKQLTEMFYEMAKLNEMTDG